MKFIFPKNYNFKPKLLGFIDYQTAIVNGVIVIILYKIANVLFMTLKFKIYFFISLYFPIFLFSIIGFQRENIIVVITYLFKFFKNRNVYLYRKNHSIKTENTTKTKYNIELLKKIFY